MPQRLALQPYVGRLVTLDASIDGTALTLLLDTGAGLTALTPEAAGAVACAPFGRVTGHRMTGETVSFARCGLRQVEIAGDKAPVDLNVFDLMALLPPGLPVVEGIAALSVFAGRPFTLDLDDAAIVLESPTTLAARLQTAREGKLRLVYGPGGFGDVLALVGFPGREGDSWFLLDSANLGPVLVSPHTLSQWGAHNAFEGAEVELDLKFAEGLRLTVPAAVKDTLYDGVLNEATLRRFEITFDLERERIWFSTPEAAPPR